MSKEGWRTAGEVARLRRERLGLNQDELQYYDGPKSSTVGKFERGAQSNFPPRTQQQIEKALGWPAGSIESILRTVDDGRWAADEDDFMERLVEENVPDLLTRRQGSSEDELTRQGPDSTVTFRLHGNFGVDVTVQGPVENLPELRDSAEQLLARMMAGERQAQE